MKFRLTILPLLALFGASSLFTGCETVQDFTKNNPAVAKATVQYATLKYIDEDTEHAQKVKEKTALARTLTSDLDGVVTVESLVNDFKKAIDFDELKPEDKILIGALIDETARRIQIDINRKILDPDALVTLNQYLNWIDEAADLFLSGTSQDEILGSYVPAEPVAASSKGFNLFEFVTGAEDWDSLVRWWKTPATIEEVQLAADKQRLTGGVSSEYSSWAKKHGYDL